MKGLRSAALLCKVMKRIIYEAIDKSKFTTVRRNRDHF